jgi:hypothetical protein
MPIFDQETVASLAVEVALGRAIAVAAFFAFEEETFWIL